MKTDQKPRKARKAPFLTSIALACALASGNASAGIPVFDGTALGRAIADFIAQVATWGTEAERWVSQFQHYQQQLTKLDQIFSQAQLAFGQQFQKRSETEGIDERCNGGSGNMLSDLISSFGLNMNGDIVAQQKALCTYIVIMQNKKYNDQVEAMNTLLQKTREDIKKQMLQLAGSSSNGGMDSNAANATAGLQTILANYQETQQRTAMYDAIISTLKEDQRQLAKRALKGDQGSSMLTSAVGAVVSTAALAGALSINETDARCTRSGNNITCDD
ncbi:MAG: hypothetical protein JF600_05455 [Xanthomonadales bacterium]|nr:hypothetical protein [Xanthomonadales bacterium]